MSTSILFDAPFTFELGDDDATLSFAELEAKHPEIPKSILQCEYTRLHYKFHLPLETDVRHAQNTRGWMDQRKWYLTSSSIATILPATEEIVEQYRRTINKGKRVEDLNDPKTVLAVKKRIHKYVIDKVDNNGIGNNVYMRWGKRFENVAKSILQQYIGAQHPIVDCDLQRHRTEACLATSLDGDIPTLNAVAEFKCIFYTTKFYQHMDWKYKEQLESQMDATNREKGYWLMCQFDTIELGLNPQERDNGFDQWAAKMEHQDDLKWTRNGIILKDLNRYETYIYPPMTLSKPREFWEWMMGMIRSAPSSTYHPVFWKLTKHKLLILHREKNWLEKRQPTMRATMRMIEYYRAPENANEFLSFKEGVHPEKYGPRIDAT